jgi:hypothetical protein
MEDIFTIELPAGVPDSHLDDLQDELKQLDGIADAGSEGARSIHIATIGLWVQAAGGVLTLVSTAVPVIEKIVSMIRGKGIKGATITLANGTSISVDEVSAKDLEKMLQAVNRQ